MIRFLKKKISLTICLILFVLGVLLATFILTGALTLALHYLGISSSYFHIGMKPPPNVSRGEPLAALLKLLVCCFLLGTALTVLFSKKALNPIRKMIEATHQVSEGNFDVEVNIKGIGELEELSESFNKMTRDLAGTETLRRDFINNFSHEFKTPIVSIRGFAKILKDGDLTEEERREYLDIIISESDRLADLSTNVLNLSKYENMNIVTETKLFPLDEQIRRRIVLMEPKWSVKELVFNVELEPVNFRGNEDIIQQIWVNLLDNSIKFSQPQGSIDVQLLKTEDGVLFKLQDKGAGMDQQTAAHIFDQFYQGDASRSKEGNGLGLALVKRIVELCGGSISVESQEGQGTAFFVWRPDLEAQFEPED